jgi:CheY-like chemotaxis protein
LKAADGREALAVARRFGGAIDLLLTDLVLPQMAGLALAAEIAGMRPATKVLFMSGYSENAVLSQGKLRPGAAFLRKPFSARDLLTKLRQVLGPRPGAAGAPA